MADPSDSDQNDTGSAFDEYISQFGDRDKNPYPSQDAYEDEFGDREENPYPSKDSYDKDFGGGGDGATLADAEEDDGDGSDDGGDDESEALEEPFEYTGKRGGDGNWFVKMKGRKRLFFIAFPLISLLFMLVISGPLKLIQIGKMFEKFHMGPNQTSSNSRVGRVMEFYRTQNDPSKRNLGYIAEKVSGRMQETLAGKGVEIGYTAPDGKNTRRMQSMTMDTSTTEGKRTFDSLKSAGFDLDAPDTPGKVTLEFRGPDGDTASARVRRKALNASIDAMGKGKISTIISKRMLRVRAGVDFHPLKNKARDATESYKDRKAKKKKERADQINNGADAGDKPISGNESKDPETGEVLPEDSTGAADSSNSTVNDTKKANTPELKKGMVQRLAGGGAAVVGVLCMMKDIGDQVPVYQHANMVLPAIRTGMEFVAIASQIQAGTYGTASFPDLEEIRIMSEIVDGTPLPTQNPVASIFFPKALAQEAPTEREIASSKPFMNAESIERQNGIATGGQPLPADIDIANVGDKPALFDVIDNIPALGSVCGAVEGVLKFFKKIPVFGSIIKAAEKVQEELIDGALSVAGTSMQDIMTGIVSWLAGDMLDAEVAAGAFAGGVADLGVYLAEKEQAVGMGGAELSSEDYAALQYEAWETRTFADSQKSFFTRTFDIRDPDSLIAQAVTKTPSLNSNTSIGQNLANLSGALVGNVRNIGSIFSQKAHAQAPIFYDYGVPASGFSLKELDDELTADPSANADIVEPELARLNEDYSGCFGTVIAPDTFTMTFEKSPDYEKIGDPKCKDGSEMLLRYRMYINDTVSTRAVACYEGLDEQSCEEMGIAGGEDIGGTAGEFKTDASELSCDGWQKITGNAGSSPGFKAYSSDIKQTCESLKSQCLGGVAGTIKALCSAFEFSDSFYGSTYLPTQTRAKYGFTASGNAKDNPSGWYEKRQPGINPTNFLDCSALTTVAVYRAFGVDGGIGCSGHWGEKSRPKYFKQVAVNELRPGDFISKNFSCNVGSTGTVTVVGGHVAIVASTVAANGDVIVYEQSGFGTNTRFSKKNMRDFQGNHSRWIGPGI